MYQEFRTHIFFGDCTKYSFYLSESSDFTFTALRLLEITKSVIIPAAATATKIPAIIGARFVTVSCACAARGTSSSASRSTISCVASGVSSSAIIVFSSAFPASALPASAFPASAFPASALPAPALPALAFPAPAFAAGGVTTAPA